MTLEGSNILVTGGTGSFGRAFVSSTLKKYNPRRLVVLSRDEKHQPIGICLNKNGSPFYNLILRCCYGS